MKTINIQAKEWFDKKNGNSYFSALITIDFGLDTEREVKVPFQYGYDNHYLSVCAHQLQTDGILPEGTIYSLLGYCQDNGITLRYSKRDKCLKHDVVA